MPNESAAAVDFVDLIPVLQAATESQGQKLTLSQILTLLVTLGPLLGTLLKRGGEAAKPQPTPTAPPSPVEADDEDEDEPTRPVPAKRTISGIAEARWFHIQAGDPGKVKLLSKPEFDSIVLGRDPLNGDLKSRLVADITPLLSDGTKLLKGMPENSLVDARYAVIFDDQRFEGDEIAQSPVVLNNLDANFRLTPRFVLGPGIEGTHTFAAEVSLNGGPFQRIKHRDGPDHLRIG